MSAAEEPIYLDNAATTEPLPEVVDRMREVSARHFGNPSSTHRFGKGPRKLLEDAREFVRGSLGAAHVVFTSGGTEADMLGVVGAAMARPPGRVLCGASDHPAVLALAEPLRACRQRPSMVPVTADGDIDPETLFDLLGSDVRVVSILHGHNELGTLPQLDELVGLVRRTSPDAHVHVDLVQAYGKIDFDLDLRGVDSVALSAHKFHGPRGIGCLALSSVAKIVPVQLGGGQEGGLRGGTENVAGAVGMALAAERALSRLAEHAAHTTALADSMFARVAAEFERAERLGHSTRRLPHILSMRIPGVVAQTLQEAMDGRGVAFSTGSACHGPHGGDNHVLKSIGMDRRQAREVLRISFSADNTEHQVATATDRLLEEATQLARLAPREPAREHGTA